MTRHDDDESTPQGAERGEPEAEVAGATIDTGVPGAGDEHLGLEGTRDIRPHTAREDLRLT